MNANTSATDMKQLCQKRTKPRRQSGTAVGEINRTNSFKMGIETGDQDLRMMRQSSLRRVLEKEVSRQLSSRQLSSPCLFESQVYQNNK